ncbi:MAG: hypothetical protein K5776_10725, partial [Lachnospiraceae bacterium]|nr:hypothetical protein [Lachnospiraceae bacterium]
LVTNKLKIIGLIVYFAVLFAERLSAVILSPAHCNWNLDPKYYEAYLFTNGNLFNYVTFAVTILSLAAGLILSVKPLIGMVSKLFSSKEYPFKDNYRSIVIAAMVMLYGGMMHTSFTLAPLQFVAYGFLIAAMIVRTMEKCISDKDKRFSSIVSVVYLTLFSMTIPVCYISVELGGVTMFFYIVEFAAAFILIPLFGIMLYRFFTEGVTTFSFVYPLIMLVLSGLAVALKWSEEINFFVLIFVCLTVVFYLALGILAGKKAA